MSCSPARSHANRQNASKSTGPKSAEGKAASRFNAFRHGLAGKGDLPGPEDDLAIVAERSVAIAGELKASGEVGRLLAYRVALLSVQMERSAHREMVAVAANAGQARAAFDVEFAEATDHLIDSLQERGNPKDAIAALQETPFGVARLIASWVELRDQREPEDADSFPIQNEAESRLGLSAEESDGLEAGDLARRIDAEVVRLEERAASMTDVARAIERARAEAGILAGFDPSPSATLARRYEAAAERGMYRAIKTIAEINRAKDREQTEPETSRGFPALPLIPPEFLTHSTPPTNTPLGSFRSAISPPSPPAMKSPEECKKRPDPRQAAQKLALSRR